MSGRRLGAASAGLFAATALANLSMVVFHRLLSQSLGHDYAQLVALLTLCNVLGALTNGVNSALVRALGADAELAGPAAVKGRLLYLLKPGLLALAGAMLLLLVPIRLVADYLKLPASVLALVVLAFGTGTLLVALRAATQGLHHFGALSFSLVAEALGRLALAWGLALRGLGAAAGLLGLLGGQVLGMLAAGSGLQGLGEPRLRRAPEGERLGWARALREGLGDSLALALFALLGYLDLLVLKHHYSDERATLYSRAALVAKSFMFLASALYLVLLPATARAAAARRDPRPLLLKFLGAAAGLNLLGLAVVWAAPGFCLRLLTGPDPATQAMAPLVPWFSLAVVPMALAQLVLGYLLALRQRHLVPALAGLALLFFVLLESQQDSEQRVVAVIGMVACLALGLGCWAAFGRRGLHRYSRGGKA